MASLSWQKNKGKLNSGLSQHLSEEQLKKIASVHVGIAGAGGLGSNLAMILVRSAFKSFTLVDFDRVEASNLNRQFFFPEDIGFYKVDALAEHLLRLEPELELRIHKVRVSEENVHELYDDCDCIMEAFDDPEGKAMLYTKMGRSGKFFVAASGLTGWGGPAMQARKLGSKSYVVGDFCSAPSPASPPMAPRVMQAAAMQADLLLNYLLSVK